MNFLEVYPSAHAEERIEGCRLNRLTEWRVPDIESIRTLHRTTEATCQDTIRLSPLRMYLGTGSRLTPPVATGGLSQPDKVRKQLQSLNGPIVPALCLWVGINHEKGCKELQADLAKHMSDRRTELWTKLIYYLLDFCSSKRYDAVRKIGSTLIDPEAAAFLSRQTEFVKLNQASWRFALSLLVYCAEPRRLLVLYLAVQSEDLSFSRYKLGTSSADGSPISETAFEALVRAISESASLLETLDEGRIDESLRKYEESWATEKESRCWCVHHDPATRRKTIYILRQTKEDHIQAVDKVVFAEKAELIVIRFFEDLETMELHARDKTARAVVSHLVGDQISQPDASYEKVPVKVEPSVLAAFVQRIADDRDPQLKLQGIKLRQAPLDGQPSIRLEVTTGESLRPTLEQLKSLQIDLLRHIMLIDLFTIRFALDEKSYPFDLKPELQADGWYQIAYSVRKIGADTRNSLEEHLAKFHKVHVYPKAL